MAAGLHAQYSLGVTGLLTIPTADMQADGTFMGGADFLPEAMMPSNWDYNTGNYFVNITFLPFVEVAYRCTLLHGEFEKGSKWNQDRSVSLRLRPLKEGKWWPAIVVGSNDAFTTGELNMFKSAAGNRFSRLYMLSGQSICYWAAMTWAFPWEGISRFVKIVTGKVFSVESVIVRLFEACYTDGRI